MVKVKQKGIFCRLHHLIRRAKISGFIDMPMRHRGRMPYARLAFLIAFLMETNILIVGEIRPMKVAEFRQVDTASSRDQTRQFATLPIVCHGGEECGCRAKLDTSGITADWRIVGCVRNSAECLIDPEVLCGGRRNAPPRQAGGPIGETRLHAMTPPPGCRMNSCLPLARGVGHVMDGRMGDGQAEAIRESNWPCCAVVGRMFRKAVA